MSDGPRTSSLPEERVGFLEPARVVHGDRQLDGRCDGLSAEAIFVVVPEGLQLGDSIVVRFALPISGSMASLQCTVETRAPSRAGYDLLGCRFSLLATVVEAEIRQYVEALRSKTVPPPPG
jgi:hypothetical protein